MESPEKKDKKNKYINPGTIVFNIIFILAYPVIVAFYAVFNAIVWILSLPSMAWAWIARKIKA